MPRLRFLREADAVALILYMSENKYNPDRLGHCLPNQNSRQFVARSIISVIRATNVGGSTVFPSTSDAPS